MGRKSLEQLRYDTMTTEEKIAYQLEKMNNNLEQINRMIVNNGHKLMAASILQCEILLATHNITNQNKVVNDEYSATLTDKLGHT